MRLQRAVMTVLLAIVASPAFAQDESTQCWDRQEGGHPANTFLNKQMTDYWRQMLKVADARLMGQLSGAYSSERTSPDGVYVNRQTRQFDANGLFQYADETCSVGMQLPCSHNQGTGEWRAANQADGSTYLMARFSDLIRTDACFGDRIRLEENGITDEGGIFWQKLP